MTKNLDNPYFKLTEPESTELRGLFLKHQAIFDANRAEHLTLIMAAKHIRLSFRQLYVISKVLAKTKEVLPDWIFDYLSTKTNGPDGANYTDKRGQ